MSGNKKPTKISNGEDSNLSARNLNHVPDETQSNIEERFIRTAAADEPYFAHARMDERTEHTSRLSAHVAAIEKIMKK